MLHPGQRIQTLVLLTVLTTLIIATDGAVGGRVIDIRLGFDLNEGLNGEPAIRMRNFEGRRGEPKVRAGADDKKAVAADPDSDDSKPSEPSEEKKDKSSNASKSKESEEEDDNPDVSDHVKKRITRGLVMGDKDNEEILPHAIMPSNKNNKPGEDDYDERRRRKRQASYFEVFKRKSKKVADARKLGDVM